MFRAFNHFLPCWAVEDEKHRSLGLGHARTDRLIEWKRGCFDANGEWVHELLPTDSIKNAVERTLLAAGLRDHALNERGALTTADGHWRSGKWCRLQDSNL